MSTVQASIFGDTNHSDVADIQTNGRIIRPLLELPEALVDELKLHVDDDGLRTTAADPANVGMVHVHAYPAAFDTYDVDTETVLGVNNLRLKDRVDRARMRKHDPDPVTLDLDERRALVTTEREYTDTTVRQTDELQLIDADTIRNEPDPPDLDHDYQATVDVDAFTDTIHNLDAGGSDITIAEEDGALTLTVDDDDSKALADFGHVAEPTGAPNPGASTRLSPDYLTDVATALDNVKVDDITVRWREEYPLAIEFKRTIETDNGDATVAYDGKFLVAPRLEKNDDA